MSTVTDDIRAKVDIVALVGESVPLKKAGRNFTAPCPFHSERTPSFFVFPDRQTWRCFGACATGGDAFSFVMRRENVTFGEALRTLASRAGVALPEPGASRQRAEKEGRLKDLHRAAAMFFYETLMKSGEAAEALAYLKGRGLSEGTMEEYRLGYCPRDRQALERRLSREGFAPAEMEAAGLLRRREDGSAYALFQGRITIPILDERSDYIAFGARAMTDSGPKYINSPQTEIFEKGSVLYGIHRAKEAIRKEGQAVIVEGYMDVLTAHQHGFQNVVAAMGTALGERQVAALTRLANRFVLALDPDAAGDEATLRSLETSWRILDRPPAGRQPAGLTGAGARPAPELFVMELPRGKDPDEVIKEAPTAWVERAAAATPVVDYVFRAVAARLDLSTPQGKAALTERLTPLVHQAGNVFEQNERIRKLADILKVEENVVRIAVGGSRAPSKRRRTGRAFGQASPPVFSETPRDWLEEYCLAMLLRFPELWEEASGVRPEHFLKAQNRVIFECLAKGTPTEELKSHLEEEVHEQLDALLDDRLGPVPRWEREEGVRMCVGRLAKRLIHVEMEAVQSQHAAGLVLEQEASERMEELKNQLRRIDGQAA